MPVQDWTELSGSVVGDSYELTNLVRGGVNRAWFEGYNRIENHPVSIRVFRAENGADLRRIARRFQEVSFLSHPNLLRILHVAELDDQVYVIGERGEYDLPQFIERRTMPPEDATDLGLQLAAGLKALHQENLVLCNLGLDAVWRIGLEWKIADFSELRVIGNADGAVRKTLARLPAVPPEAFEGQVLPAWDVWSLGVLLQKVLTPLPGHLEGSVSLPRGRQIRFHGLPEPFEEITRDCLLPDPEARITLTGLEQKLSIGQPAPPPSFAEELGVASPAVENHVPPGRPLNRYYEDEGKKSQLWKAFVMGILVVVAALGFWAMKDRVKAEGTKGADSEQNRQRTAPVATFGTPDKGKPTPAVEPKIPERPTDGSIEQVLTQWAQATKAKDAAAVASFYAPRIRSFYSRHNLTREQIRQDRAKVFSQIGQVRKLDITNVQVTQLAPSSAVALFDKTWDFGPRYAGSERAQLSFGKYGGGWKITTERELKVYWAKKP